MKIDQAEDIRRLYGISLGGTDAVPYPTLENGLKVGSTHISNANLLNSLGGRLLKANTAASSTLAATSATTFSNGTATIAADSLSAGDVIRFRAVVHVASVDGTDSFQVLVKYAGSTIFDSTAVGSVVQDDLLILDGEITTHTVHASTGTAYAAVTAVGELAGSPVTLAPGTTLSSLANAAAHTLIIQGEWGGAGNTAVLRMFNVYKN